jgi:signal transduction histidine kinase/CheY-like chemotaxis protein
MRRAARVLLAAALLAGLFLHVVARAAPAAQAGRITLATGDLAQPVELEGEWGFAWNDFTDPQRPPAPQAFATVPGSWNGVTAAGKPAGPDGWGSYQLQVDCPAGERVALAVPAERTAVRLYVNGELAMQQGEPGRDAASTRPAIRGRAAVTAQATCPLQLVMHVANYSHRAGGFVRPLVLGRQDVLAMQLRQSFVSGAAVIGAYFVLGLVPFIFWLGRRQDGTPLMFGLMCLAMGIYADMTGERVLLQWFARESPWELYLKVEYLAWFTAMGLFVATVRRLFPQEAPVRAAWAIYAAATLGLLVVAATPSRVYSYLVGFGQALIVCIAVYANWSVARAARHQREGAAVMFAGMAFLFVVLMLDFLQYNLGPALRSVTPFGVLAFVLAPAIVMARRLARALNAEEQKELLLRQNTALEENARLREDVERMSRHDMKTPLNSIVGATRLMAEDPRVAAEHRELLRIAERAAYRLLEMVNLSGDLARMEAGTYAFRPQAVNLAEVLSRVMVDTHGLAEAGKVSVQLSPAVSQPVYARAEELLCYSIVANVLKNAIEATPPGGAVTVSLEGGDVVRLAVHNAQPVPAEIASRFFEKYVTAGKAGGTGLGSYSARLMARVQEGDLRMATSPDEGTTVTLTLHGLAPDTAPAPLQPALLPPVAPAPVSAGDFRPSHVLLVDDDEYNRLILRRYLPTPPFTVDTAVNGRGALDAAARQWPDVVLIDMEMPVINGAEAVAQLRAREQSEGLPRPVIVMLSSNDDEASIRRGLDAGSDRYLTKPVTREALLATLRELGAAAPQSDTVQVEDALVAELPGFLASRRGLLRGMRDALAAGDRAALQSRAHRAAGGFSLFGFSWAAAACRRIEAAAALGTAAAIEADIDAVLAHLDRVRVDAKPAGD